ncbi:T7SS effector LXG polymorphic toxin [Streptococcus macacae]|uniref:LXG domain-containing protein n=2 Tax=Streptococcus TaxID=1301 RepID=G5JZ67_9STRE|nr:T7SS effector LXG polymorphic toxin [Streptococcus macacae]EHJ52055.1 hypothetical protein STRMA_0484 [Streptococcus macacae NCTC 11558]SUN78319.1 membrane protein [Streptococcus macacae NCTC 11558]
MVKMVLGSSDAQASSVGTLADNYKAGFEQLVKSIDQLANEDRLSGSAYSNIKNYGSSVVKPLAQAFVLLAEAAKADIKKLPDEYRASVGNEDLDEETLTAQIHALNSTLATNRATKTAMKRIDSAADTQSFDQAISADEGTKRDLEEKLRKLREYNAKSSGFFSDIAGLESAVNTGLSQLQSGISGFNGTFTLPSKKELAWTKTIKSQWEQREAYLAAAAKVNKGDKLTDKDAKAIKAYQKNHPGLNIDKSVIKAADKKMGDVKDFAKQLSKEIGISYEEAYNFIVNGVLSDENKQKMKLLKNSVKYAKGGLYIKSSYRYWLKHKGEWTDEMFKARTFSKGGAQIEDVKYAGKYLKKSKKLKTITSKLTSYEHGRLNRDLKMMKENQVAGRLGKIGKAAGKALKVAGWLGTAIDAKVSAEGYKKKGYSNEQTAALATRKVAVDMTASAVGSNVGRVAGAWVGQMIIPIPGVGAAIGSVAGSILGGIIGSKVGDAVNAQMDKGVKPKKSGWSWPW